MRDALHLLALLVDEISKLKTRSGRPSFSNSQLIASAAPQALACSAALRSVLKLQTSGCTRSPAAMARPRKATDHLALHALIIPFIPNTSTESTESTGNVLSKTFCRRAMASLHRPTLAHPVTALLVDRAHGASRPSLKALSSASFNAHKAICPHKAQRLTATERLARVVTSCKTFCHAFCLSSKSCLCTFSYFSTAGVAAMLPSPGAPLMIY